MDFLYSEEVINFNNNFGPAVVCMVIILLSIPYTCHVGGHVAARISIQVQSNVPCTYHTADDSYQTTSIKKIIHPHKNCFAFNTIRPEVIRLVP